MSMIRVENITFSYPSSFDPVFENVSFQIDTEWKLGLVGRNGRGKTTLLKLLLGEYEYRGKITGAVTFDYFPFPVSDKTQMTEGILRQVCQNARQWELIRELSYLGIESEVLWRPFETMSNGEQTKALLAALFLKEEHFLLIDEPTNHLDVEGRRQMADYLKRKRGFILVSHDRYLLDECVDHILSLNRSNIEIQSGNFSSWMENFKKRQNFEINRNESLKKDIRRMKESARQAKVWSDKVESSKRGAADKGYVGHKAAKMMKRSKNAEARKERAAEEKSKLLNNAEYAEMLKITPLMYHSEKLVSFSDVAVIYEGNQVCDAVTFQICRGERILIQGKNGSGKSSLLKLLLKYPIEHTHVDAPYHFSNSGETIDNMELDFFLGEAVVVRVTDKKADEAITLEDIEPYKEEICEGKIVLFNTNWYKTRGTDEFFHHPYVNGDVAKYLVDNGVRFIGIDTINADQTGGTEFPVHDLFSEKRLMIGENWAFFDQIDFERPYVIALPMKLIGCDGSPVRAIAVQWEEE